MGIGSTWALRAACALVSIAATACSPFSGDDSDGAALNCPDCRVVFVTSVPTDANLGGLAGADARCNELAGKSTHPAVQPRSFVAWLSGATSPANGRHVRGGTRYVRPDGVVIANNWNDLTDGTLIAPINVDEKGATVMGQDVWTGTTKDGFSSKNTCVDWTTTSDKTTAGQIGRTDKIDESWTDGDELLKYSLTCDKVAPFYCIEK